MRCVPLPKSYCVREGRATVDNSAGRFDVGTMIEENVDHSNVIAARSPVERGFGMTASELRIDIGAICNQGGHSLRIIREMAGPVRSYVKQGALTVDPCFHKIGVLAK